MKKNKFLITILIFFASLFLSINCYLPVLSQGNPTGNPSTTPTKQNTTPTGKTNQNSNPKPNSPSLTIEEEKEEDDSILEELWDKLSQPILAILSTLLGFLAYFLNERLKEAKKKIDNANQDVENANREVETANERVEAIRKPVELKPEETINSVMVVGLGGSGKSSLIKSIVGGSEPEKRTGSYEIFSKQTMIPADNGKKVCKIYK